MDVRSWDDQDELSHITHDVQKIMMSVIVFLVTRLPNINEDD